MNDLQKFFNIKREAKLSRVVSTLKRNRAIAVKENDKDLVEWFDRNLLEQEKQLLIIRKALGYEK